MHHRLPTYQIVVLVLCVALHEWLEVRDCEDYPEEVEYEGEEQAEEEVELEIVQGIATVHQHRAISELLRQLFYYLIAFRSCWYQRIELCILLHGDIDHAVRHNWNIFSLLSN